MALENVTFLLKSRVFAHLVVDAKVVLTGSWENMVEEKHCNYYGYAQEKIVIIRLQTFSLDIFNFILEFYFAYDEILISMHKVQGLDINKLNILSKD